MISIGNKQDLYAIGGIDCVTSNQEVLRGIFIEKYFNAQNEWVSVDLKTSAEWDDFSHLWSLKGHSSVLLPDGNILIIGG